MINFLTEPFSYEFMQKAFFGVVLAAINCSLIGVYVVLRRMSFMGGALSHTILPGIVFAYIKSFSLFFGALGASVLTALGVGWLSYRKEIREDAAIGVVLSAMFALGVMMISFVKSFRDFGSILFGSVLGVTNNDLWLILTVTSVVTLVLILFKKEIELSSYDPDYSQTIGIKPTRLRYLLLILIALSVVSAVQIVGALLATALLVTPAATACLIGRTLRQILWYSVIIGVISGITGLILSFHFKVASGAAIVLICSLIFILVWTIRNIHDWLWKRNKELLN